MIEKGAECNAREHFQRTPLHLAACQGHIGVVQELLLRGASVNAHDGEFKTPLHLAAETAPSITSLSLHYKEKTVKQNLINQEYGKQALIIEKLLNAQADINAEDHSCLTALELVFLSHRNKQVIQALLINGARCISELYRCNL